MKKEKYEYENMKHDEYHDIPPVPLVATFAAAFWSIMAVVVLIEVIRLIVWLIKMI